MSGLGTRTKRVLTYGRRGHRIVNTTEEKHDQSPEPESVVPEHRQNLQESSPKPKQRRAKASSPMKARLAKAAASPKTQVGRPNKPIVTRHPLAAYESNMPGSPARPPRKRSTAQIGCLKPTSPVVNVDIIVIDEEGRRVSQEQRFSRMDVQANSLTESPSPAKPRAQRPSKRKFKDVSFNKPVPISRISISSDTEDESRIQSKHKTPRSRKRAIIISSDESEDEEVISQKPIPPLAPYPNQKRTDSLELPAYKEFVVRSQPRQLTPIHRGKNIYPRPPSPSPSLDSDLDVELQLADLSISSLVEDETLPPPDYLLPLLAECQQTTPHEFSAFIETFPFDPVVRTRDQGPSKLEFRKIGEASYSEVFGIGDVVLKIIPLRNEGDALGDADVDSPSPSDAKDVLKEINVTKSMGEICDGFIKLLRAYVVRGKYPSLLLSCWDEFNESKGSESIKPDTFPVSQTYAIIVLPNGGPDLEAYTFVPASKKRWSQASSIFWQIVRTLGNAEELVSFEHRDLHWGQLLVQNTSPGTNARRKAAEKASMDAAIHAVAVTIIDLGLARMDASRSMTHWTPFEPEVFEGEGDYQFDVYRMMREHNGDSWVEYRPLTNVMWLHYILNKILTSKKLRPPAVPRKTTAGTAKKPSTSFSERECYECLVDMERLLGIYLEKRLQKRKPAVKARRKTTIVAQAAELDGAVQPFTCAGDVLKHGISMGWVCR